MSQIKLKDNNKKPCIAAIVLNSVGHDARVLKEADSLASAGYEMHIVGIQDNKCDEAFTKRPSGVVIHRVPLRSLAYMSVLRSKSRASMIGVISIVAVAAFIFLIPKEEVNGWDGLLVATVLVIVQEVLARGISGLLVATVLVIAFAKLFRRYRLFRSLAKSKAAELVFTRSPHTPKNLSIKPFVKKKTYQPYGLCITLLKVIKKTNKFRLASSLFQIKLDNIMPDAVHCHDLPMLPIGAKWCKGHNKSKLVFDSHELYEEISNITSVERFFCQRTLRKHAPQIDGFITINDSIAKEHAKRYPQLKRAVIVKNASIFDASPLKENTLALETSLLHDAACLSSEKKILLYQGGYAKHRGLELLIESAAGLPESWALVMMGWGNIEEKLKKLATSVGPAGDNIRFIPPAPHHELALWTSGASLGVIPYENTCLNHWFCTPNKLWEYPIAGVPMLVSPFPELMRVAVDEGVGLALPSTLNKDTLMDLLNSLDDEKLEGMQYACRKFVQKDNWAVYSKRLNRLYVELLGEPIVTASELKNDESLEHKVVNVV